MPQTQTLPNLTPMDRLKRLEGWLHLELHKLNQQKLLVGHSLGSQELRDRLFENYIRKTIYTDVLNMLNQEEDSLTWQDKMPDPEKDGSLYADSN